MNDYDIHFRTIDDAIWIDRGEDTDHTSRVIVFDNRETVDHEVVGCVVGVRTEIVGYINEVLLGVADTDDDL